MARKTLKSRSVSATRSPLDRRLSAFVAERYPFALEPATRILEELLSDAPEDPDGLEKLRRQVRRALSRSLRLKAAAGTPEPTPGVPVRTRLKSAADEVVEAVDGFFRREAIAASLTHDERVEMLKGMILTRAVDNQLKQFFLGGAGRYAGTPFQGKGFRSLGQEAIYACTMRLRRGEAWRGDDGTWQGDVVAPLIRDLGAALGMRQDDAAVRQVLSAQAGRAGPPMDGRDFHIGDLDHGVLPATAPLSISTLTAAGLSMAFALRETPQVAVAFIGEGGSSLGEWHEAINLCAARRLPAVFCVQNNQTALSTPVPDQSAVRVFAEKAAGYGVPGLTIDGTDPDAIAAAFGWAAERAREGHGPALIETVSMRMCGHAHHDDMLYLGKEQEPGWEYPERSEAGYADPEAWDYWKKRDPLIRYAATLKRRGILARGEFEQFKAEADQRVRDAAQAVVDAPWPEGREAGERVLASGPAVRHVESLEDRENGPEPTLPDVEPAPPFHPKGRTFLDAIQLGVGDALRRDDRVFVYGQDVGGKYGNAFLLLRPLLEKYGDRILNATLAEGGIIGVCVGSALAGMRPIGEIQFNDFIATGFNQLVNNAAKTRYRWGGSVPMVLRMPWGGLRRAGPYHSQNTEPWFYRTPGLKIVAPSTPYDARAAFAAAVADPDPVLFYEHIGLYRNPKIKQRLERKAPEPLELGKAALRRSGSDLAIVSYGAFVHRALAIAEKLAADGIEAAVLDLRSLAPLDEATLLRVARHCGRVLVIHEDSRRGGIGESLAAIVQEQAFEYLDAPVRVVGALDTPVPYSPPLEDEFLPSDDFMENAARRLAAY